METKNFKKVFAAATVAMMVATATPVMAVNSPETVNTTATINLNKVLNLNAGDRVPNVDSFEFTLTPLSYTLAEDGVINTNTAYMPKLANNGSVTVDVALNAQRTQMTGSKSVQLDFTGKSVGVYTYTLTEVNTDVPGIEYDDSFYYLNVYIANQVDENNEPTGLVTISDITAWRTNNMTGEALQGVQQDTEHLPDPEGEEGKVGRSDPANPAIITYPFTNEYNTTASLSVKKVVSGNYASKKQAFNFSVNVNDGGANRTYDVVYYKNNVETPGLNGNPATITAGTTTNVKLAHNEKMLIADLPTTASYTVTELQTATYKASVEQNGGEVGAPKKATASVSANLQATGVFTDNSMLNGILTEEEVVYTNTKSYTVPTGIIINMLPFVMAIAVAGTYAVITSRKAKEE